MNAHFASFAARLTVLLLTSLALGSFRLSAKPAVEARRGQITLPTYPWSGVKHPYFRGTDQLNIYPYPMLDFIGHDPTNRAYRTVVIENEFLRVTILPELGGKIYEVIDKTTAQPMFYVNRVIKPGLLAQCGAWTSGGVEWNTGPQGHTVGCMQPMLVDILPPQPDGSRTVAIGERERIYGTQWTVQLTLRPGRSFIEERIRIYNSTPMVRPYYFWNNTAVPNTPGFRFIYPMTLGTDHGGTEFFHWPIHEGRDLTRGSNYLDAASIFAVGCDQDFFGSYNDDLDRGVVSCANHFDLPGKKAWTWGWGGYGVMHQRDLTDREEYYNEIQTGPLLTQGEVGRLEPCEAVSWQEWWYPIHGLGGFTFANRDLAALAALEGHQLRLKMLGTARWKEVEVIVRKPDETNVLASAKTALTPQQPSSLLLNVQGAAIPFQIEIKHRNREVLARFRYPLDLPVRQPPVKRAPSHSAAELAAAGWQDYLFARYAEAEDKFRKALEKDGSCLEALAGLSQLKLDPDPEQAARQARKALALNPDYPQALYLLAVAEYRLGHESEALEQAWKAALHPATAVPARALIGKLYLRRNDFQRAKEALSAPGPWNSDPTCRNRLSLALHLLEDYSAALAAAKENLQVDPLDAFARFISDQASHQGGRWRRADKPLLPLSRLLNDRPQLALELALDCVELGKVSMAYIFVPRSLFYYRELSESGLDRLALYLGGHIKGQDGRVLNSRIQPDAGLLNLAQACPPDGVFPHRLEFEPVLRWALEANPQDGHAALYLGHLLFHLGRHAEGRRMWKRAAELGAAPALAYRALGMASLTLEDDPKAAAQYLNLAHQADSADPIAARDLAKVLSQLARQTSSGEDKQKLNGKAIQILQAAFPAGQGRADYVSLLARLQNAMGQFAETARLLDSVRVIIWEGSREVHDLFEEAHLALGRAHLEAGRAAEALAEFNRALEYPANLATGRLETVREAHIHYLRGNALAALSQMPAAKEAWRKAADESASNDPKKEEARRKAKEALLNEGSKAPDPH